MWTNYNDIYNKRNHHIGHTYYTKKTRIFEFFAADPTINPLVIFEFEGEEGKGEHTKDEILCEKNNGFARYQEYITGKC